MNSLLTGLKISLPTLMCFTLIVFNACLYSLIPFYRVPIPFVLSVIFYFGIFHPAVLNVVCVFCLGLLADLIGASPFGLNTFFYVLLFFVANLNRRFFLTLNFNDLWVSFCAVLASIFILWYLFFMLVGWTIVPFGPILFQYAFLVLTYPIMAWICGWINLKIGGL